MYQSAAHEIRQMHVHSEHKEDNVKEPIALFTMLHVWNT